MRLVSALIAEVLGNPVAHKAPGCLASTVRLQKTELSGPSEPGYIHLFIPVQSIPPNSFIYSFMQATLPIPCKSIPFCMAH